MAVERSLSRMVLGIAQVQQRKNYYHPDSMLPDCSERWWPNVENLDQVELRKDHRSYRCSKNRWVSHIASPEQLCQWPVKVHRFS